MEEHITIQLQGDECTVSIPPDSYYRVKVPTHNIILDAAGDRRFPVRTSATFALPVGEQIHLDVYGPGGEGYLASMDVQRETSGLVEHQGLNNDIAIEIKA